MRVGRTHAVTHQGRRRTRNEDAYVLDPPLFAVADGVGGAQAGEVASRLAASTLQGRDGGLHGSDALAELVRDANARVFQRSLDDPEAAGMGTTVTAALFDDEAETVALGHVGDSRAYLVRAGSLEQLTDDHSLVAELVRSGRLTQEEAEIHPQRRVITRVLGTDADVEVDTLTVQAQAGDLYVLCSDGLPAMVRDEDISRIVEQAGAEPKAVAEALVAAANRAGGEDNITVVAFEVDDRDVEPDEATVESALDDTHAIPPVEQPKAVRRHGAGPGGRALALLAILLALAAAIVLVWWGIAQ